MQNREKIQPQQNEQYLRQIPTQTLQCHPPKKLQKLAPPMKPKNLQQHQERMTKTGPTTTNQNATNNNNKNMEQPSTNKSTEQPTPVKRKLTTNSPQIHHKKTEDTKTPNEAQTTDITNISKDSKPTETKILIYGKACMQRNLDFSAGQHKTKIPMSNKARVGQFAGNHGPNTKTRPRSRSRSRHKEPGPPEGQGKDTR